MKTTSKNIRRKTLTKPYPNEVMEYCAELYSKKLHSASSIARIARAKFNIFINSGDIARMAKLKGIEEIPRHELMKIAVAEKKRNGLRYC